MANKNACAECGMPVRLGEYHPYAACLMFKGCHNSRYVRKNLKAITCEWRDIGRREQAHEVPKTAKSIVNDRVGYDALWLWFGLSYANWLTLPRVLMHEMPDKWQAKMAELLNEWDETWTNTGDAYPVVQLRKSNKFTKMPEFLKNYRRPDIDAINKCR